MYLFVLPSFTPPVEDLVRETICEATGPPIKKDRRKAESCFFFFFFSKVDSHATE